MINSGLWIHLAHMKVSCLYTDTENSSALCIGQDKWLLCVDGLVLVSFGVIWQLQLLYKLHMIIGFFLNSIFFCALAYKTMLYAKLENFWLMLIYSILTLLASLWLPSKALFAQFWDRTFSRWLNHFLVEPLVPTQAHLLGYCCIFVFKLTYFYKYFYMQV